MIFIGRCPYRISLLGGGSDLDWFVAENGYGNSIGFSLAEYSYTVINKKDLSSKYGILNYSSRETYSSLDNIAHSLIRESLKYFNISEFIEMSSFGFSTGGGGLGGSSSFCMSFLSSINLCFNLKLSTKEIANICSEIEINVLGKPIGRQDQYLSSLGGINALVYSPQGKVKIESLSNNQVQAIKKVSEELLLIPSLRTRSADKVLSKFKDSIECKNSLIDIREICKTFLSSRELSVADIYKLLNQSIKDSWEIKRRMSNVMDSQLEEQYSSISEIPHNWIRLIGAGSGGYFLLSTKLKIQEAINSLSLKNITAKRVYIDHIGLHSASI
jgi:D-glycero-alpha-D-manno-heptose-7-phosphate kinase